MMCRFKIQILVLVLLIVIASEGKRWYPATIFERDDKSNTTKTDDLNYIQNNQKFIPIITVNGQNNGAEKKGWKFHKSQANDIHNGELNNVTFKMSTPKTQILRYNNTINIINLTKRIPPRKKIVRRRCPSVRQDRRFFSDSARTRFLEVFEVIEFDHVVCTSSSGLEGTCLPESECRSSGGSTMGTCADGYGTCCITQFRCDEQSSSQTGWFTNPDFPSPSTERLSCTVTLDKFSEDIKQIRLDFMNFELLPPTGGTCQQDQFIVFGQNVNNIIPILCGVNTGQHVYIEVGNIDGPLYLSVQTVSPENRLFAIKVTQLTATDQLTAPTGCFQHFTEPHGFFESFNYRDKSDIGIARAPGYLNNLNYAICINRSPGTCSVTYHTDFMQITNYDDDGLPVIPPGQAGVEIFNCPGDWLLISATRLCGERLNDGSVLQDFSLNAPVTGLFKAQQHVNDASRVANVQTAITAYHQAGDSSAGPIVVWFRSDEGYVGRGFRLRYQQNACNGTPQ